MLSVVVAMAAGCAAGRPAEAGATTPTAVGPTRATEVPRDYGVAGWLTAGPMPGQLGPAVIAGQVDSRTGPAVFYRLRDLRPGDQLRADGRVVRFEVESLARYPKRELPDDEVFGATTTPALRLITCAGGGGGGAAGR